jgi:VWFA-related protein
MKTGRRWIGGLTWAAPLFLACIVISGPGSAQPPQASSSQTTSEAPQARLKSETRLVQLSVVVHNKSGAPVRDLQKADFVVLDEKQPQTIQLFSMETNLPPTVVPAPLPPGTYTNRLDSRAGVPNSVTVVLLDGLNTTISDQAFARRGVVKFLGQVKPEDRVAVYTLGRDLRILHDFTNDASSLVRSVQQFNGRSSLELAASSPNAISGFGPQAFTNELDSINFLFGDESQKEAAFYTQNRVHETVEAMKDIANHVAGLPGRKNLIWVSGSFPIAFGFDNTQQNIFAEKQSFDSDIADAVRALNNASLAVYPVDARGLLAPGMLNSTSTSLTSQMSQTQELSIGQQSISFRDMPIDSNLTMEALASGTGGRAFYNTNDIFGSIRQAIDDSEVTYSLGYYPAGIKWDGKYRSVKVEVHRPGVKVQARKGYFALPEPKLTPQVRQAVIAEVARNPLDSTGIGVTAIAHQVGTARALKTSVVFDLRDVSMEQKDGAYDGAVDIVMLDLNDQNKILGALDQTFQLKLPPALYAKLLKEGISLTKELPVAPDAVQLRVVVRDANTGTMGTVRIPIADYFPATKTAH